MPSNFLTLLPPVGSAATVAALLPRSTTREKARERERERARQGWGEREESVVGRKNNIYFFGVKSYRQGTTTDAHVWCEERGREARERERETRCACPQEREREKREEERASGERMARAMRALCPT
jgi:hypothetical protein